MDNIEIKDILIKIYNNEPLNIIDIRNNYEYQYGAPPFAAADITIPATVSNGGVTYKVVEIGDFAFADYIYNQEYRPENKFRPCPDFLSSNRLLPMPTWQPV